MPLACESTGRLSEILNCDPIAATARKEGKVDDFQNWYGFVFFEKNEMLIFKIARKKIFCHYSAIISVVQLYICLLVPFLLFGKPMNCISKKQGFWNQQTGI